MEPLIPERPLRISEMFVATYLYLRRNLAATIGVGALLATVTSAISGIVVNGMLLGQNQGSALDRLIAGETLTAVEAQRLTQQVTDAAPLLALAFAVSMLVQLAAMGIMTLGMVDVLRGERPTPASLWRRTPWRRIVGVNIAIVVMELVASALPVALAFMIGGAVGLAALGLAAIVAVSVAVFTALAVPAAVMHDLGVRAALTRSIAVNRHGALRTAWALLLTVVVWQMLGGFLGNPIGVLAGIAAGGPSSSTGSALTSLVASIVSGAISLPAIAGMTTIIYVDRLRRSGMSDGGTLSAPPSVDQ